MIEAYFDESEQKDGTFSVAGYCYFPPKAKKLVKKWEQILEGRIFHATDMNSNWGEFEGLDKESSSKMYKDLIATLVEHAEFGIAMSVNPREVTAKWPKLDGFRTAYAICCYMVIGRISAFLDDQGIKSRVAYIFESGHKHQNETERVMNSIKLREGFHYLSHSFASKKDAPLLQTADLLAWEWTKCSSETGFPRTIENPKRSMRKSLQRLLFSRPERACIGHFTGKQLDSFLAEIEDILQRLALPDTQ